MKVYKEIKEITKCVSKIRKLEKILDEKIDASDIDWSTAEFVGLTKKDIERFEKTHNACEEYFVEQHTGYCEDDFYGWLWFKTDVNGQYVKVHFHC